MIVKISKNWLPEERLWLIELIAHQAMTTTSRQEVAKMVMTIECIASYDKQFLERDRATIFRDADLTDGGYPQ